MPQHRVDRRVCGAEASRQDRQLHSDFLERVRPPKYRTYTQKHTHIPNTLPALHGVNNDIYMNIIETHTVVRVPPAPAPTPPPHPIEPTLDSHYLYTRLLLLLLYNIIRYIYLLTTFGVHTHTHTHTHPVCSAQFSCVGKLYKKTYTNSPFPSHILSIMYHTCPCLIFIIFNVVRIVFKYVLPVCICHISLACYPKSKLCTYKMVFK